MSQSRRIQCLVAALCTTISFAIARTADPTDNATARSRRGNSCFATAPARFDLLPRLGRSSGVDASNRDAQDLAYL
jgi:hypothetical protein